jgi:hypothetical protein
MRKSFKKGFLTSRRIKKLYIDLLLQCSKTLEMRELSTNWLIVNEKLSYKDK